MPPPNEPELFSRVVLQPDFRDRDDNLFSANGNGRKCRYIFLPCSGLYCKPYTLQEKPASRDRKARKASGKIQRCRRNKNRYVMDTLCCRKISGQDYSFIILLFRIPFAPKTWSK